MSKPKILRLFIDGEWKDTQSGEYTPVYNPSTGEVIAEAPRCTSREVSDAVEAAAGAYPAWRDTPVTQRVQVLFRYKSILENHLDELAVLVSTEMGKNLSEARGDVLKAIEVVELACAVPVSMAGYSLANVSSGFDTVANRVSLGVFVGIAPYNFPAMIPMGWMAPLAIATGNTYVLKAASMVPQSAMRMAELYIEAGLPKGVLNIVTCSRNEVDTLITHPKVKGITFVGSLKVGQLVYSKAAAAGKRVQCLVEAKNHALILRDAPIGATAQRVINSACGCAGQRCMALPSICIEEPIADKFVSEVVRLAKKLKLGPAWDPATELGPLVTDEHRRSVVDWIEQGVKEGAQLVLDGRNVTVKGYEKGFFLGATVFDRVKPGMRIGIDEIFGPVLSVKRVKDFEEGLAIMNESDYGNGSSIFTMNGYYAREFTQRTEAGMVGVNVGIPVPISVFPFCGHKKSFLGDLHVMGRDGVAFFTETRSVTTYWFTEKDFADAKVGTWEGTITRK
jgi:malonate-semialdehyde dehydrogenase (acetylating) / methylmalonate-semialdehyde dehydrogenase